MKVTDSLTVIDCTSASETAVSFDAKDGVVNWPRDINISSDELKSTTNYTVSLLIDFTSGELTLHNVHFGKFKSPVHTLIVINSRWCENPTLWSLDGDLIIEQAPINISAGTGCTLDRDFMLKIINAVPEVVGTHNIKISKTTSSNISAADIALAIAKGWTVQVV